MTLRSEWTSEKPSSYHGKSVEAQYGYLAGETFAASRRYPYAVGAADG